MNRAVRRARATRRTAVPLTRRRSTGYRTSTMQVCMILSIKVLTSCAVDRATVGEKKIAYPAFDKSHPVPRTTGITLVCILLAAANGLAWTWALAEFADQRTLLGAAILAHTFGLRHAVDSDHIAAICIFGGGSIGIITEIVQHYGDPWPAIGKFNHWLGTIDYVALCFFVLSLVISA